jgi:hypothetical protein
VPSSTYCMASSPQVNQRDGPYEFPHRALKHRPPRTLGPLSGSLPAARPETTLHAHGCAVLPFPPPSMPASVHCARSTRALRWVLRIAVPPAPSAIAPEARRPTRQCDWTSPVGSRQASVIYLPGSVPVIFLMPLAPARSTAAFTTAKIAPWTAATINTSLVL